MASSALIFDWIFLSLGCINKDNHNILNEFEIQPDPTTDCGQLDALERLEKFR